MSALPAHRHCSHIPGLIVESGSITALDQIDDPTVGLALWQRRLPSVLSHWLDGLPVDRLPDRRLLVRVPDIEAAVTGIVTGARLRGREAGLLIGDITTLARRFARLARVDQVDIRLETLHHDGCSRFHRDFVPLRLITTYRGPGTQWVAPVDAEAALKAQGDYTGPIRQMPVHAVSVFKGEGHGLGHGIVHRSPPIAGTGLHRLLLCLNLPSPASPALWR